MKLEGQNPETTLETLIPDFKQENDIQRIIDVALKLYLTTWKQ